MSIDLFWEIIRPLSMKEMIETGMLRFCRCFSKIYKKEERQRVDKIGERADLWPTLMFTSKLGEEMSFHV